MRISLFTAAAAFILCSGISIAQAPFPSVSAKDVPELRVLREASYDGTSLWGYIDGGADVYLEYGFTKVLARKATVGAIGYQIDLYQMNDAESAFGIFSIFAFTCTSGDSLTRYQCLSRYQAQAARGRFYISVINDKGSAEAQATGIRIIRSILAQIDPATDIRLPSLFGLPIFQPRHPSFKFIKGRLGLQNGFPEFENSFTDSSAYSLYIMEAHSDSSELTLASIRFDAEDGRTHFIAQRGFSALSPDHAYQERTQGAITRCLWALPDDHVVYLELKAPAAQKDSILSAIRSFLRH